MITNKIDLGKYKGNRSSLFTGRPQGEVARKELGLDEIDRDNEIEVLLTIPEGTTSFNPSFYLGLLYKSIKYLGVNSFKNKYVFEINCNDDKTREGIEKNLEDGLRNAINSMNKKTGLTPFLK